MTGGFKIGSTKVPINYWSEPIDADLVALHGRVRYVRRGAVFGLTVFKIVERHARWGERDALRQQMIDIMVRDHHGYFPYVCSIESADKLGLA